MYLCVPVWEQTRCFQRWLVRVRRCWLVGQATVLLAEMEALLVSSEKQAARAGVGLGAAANKRTAKLWPPRTMITPRWYRGGEQDAGKQAGRPDTRGQPTNKQQRMCGKWNFESSAEKRAKPSATNGVQAPPACLRPLPVTALRRSGSRPRKGEAGQTLRRQCYRWAEAMAAAAAAAAD